MSVAALSEALPLAGWENFYVIVGSSAAALTGLTSAVLPLFAHNAWDVVAWITTERHAHKDRRRHADHPP